MEFNFTEYQDWLKEVHERIKFLKDKNKEEFNKTFGSVFKDEDFECSLITRKDNIRDLDEKTMEFTLETMDANDLTDILPIHNSIAFTVEKDEITSSLRIDENSLVKYYNNYFYNMADEKLVSINKAAHYCYTAYYEWVKRWYNQY